MVTKDPYNKSARISKPTSKKGGFINLLCAFKNFPTKFKNVYELFFSVYLSVL